jgi:S1-C subfamily serine protease
LLTKIGFEQGDIVEEVNGSPVKNISELISAVWKSDDNSRIAVKAGCQGDQRNLTYHYGNSNKTPNYSSKQIKQAVNAGSSTGITAHVSW